MELGMWLGWRYKKFVLNFGGETYWETPAWKTGRRWEVDGTSVGPYLVANLNISGVKPLGSAASMFVIYTDFVQGCS
jgi:hypothetical protein